LDLLFLRTEKEARLKARNQKSENLKAAFSELNPAGSDWNNIEANEKEKRSGRSSPPNENQPLQ